PMPAPPPVSSIRHLTTGSLQRGGTSWPVRCSGRFRCPASGTVAAAAPTAVLELKANEVGKSAKLAPAVSCFWNCQASLREENGVAEADRKSVTVFRRDCRRDWSTMPACGRGDGAGTEGAADRPLP